VVWVWDLSRRRPLFVRELDLLADLLGIATRLSRVVRDDGWSWTSNPDGRYSVKSAYSHLFKALPAAGIPKGVVLQAASAVWKSWAPSKVIVFSWQLLLDRIPSRSNLIRRGVHLPIDGRGCVFCDGSSESSVHLFLSCPSFFPVWYQVSRWLGWEFVMPLGLALQFQAFTRLGGGRRVRLGLLLVWHAVIWTIWASRNDLIFAGGALREEPVVDRVKLLAWKWFQTKCSASPCSLYEWEVQPVLCLYR